MQKMTLFIKINEPVDSKALYERVRNFKMNVTDLGDKVYVHGVVNIHEPFIEYILQVCYEYSGNLSVDLTPAKQ